MEILGLIIIGLQLFQIIQNHKLKKKLMATLDEIIQLVTDENTVIEGAVTLLGTLKTELDAAIASNDPTKLQALSDMIGAEKQKLADAIVANTPTE